MLKSWTKILPYFIVTWYIKQYGEKFIAKNQGIYVTPYPDCLIILKR